MNDRFEFSPQDPIVVMTGAGISAESGIKTFRGTEGLWENHRLEDVATPEAFERNPQLVHDFYNARRRQLKDREIKPNAAHFALAELEKNWKAPVLLITQNVDNLHQRAGSQNILPMHGELTKIRCLNCGEISLWEEDLDLLSRCPSCSAQGRLRPNIVWFGELPLDMEEIDEALSYTGIYISIGTSNQVYPAAGFILKIRSEGRAQTFELNLESTPLSHLFHQNIYAPASQSVPKLVKELLNKIS